MSTAQVLNPLTLPFGGSRLIEASAGTGKTYTISGLYLRLLLGDGIPQPLGCEQILVVTFTNAATQELRDRIRRRIQQAFKCFLGLPTEDVFIRQLYESIPEAERATALKRLDLALKSLDEAAIYTIHGFCQRILSDMAFESSLLFESEFTLDDSEFLHHAVRDFWREACYPLSEELAQIIANQFGDPDNLLRKLRPLLGASQAEPKVQPVAFGPLTQELSQSLSRFRLVWPRERQALLELLHELPLNGARFGKAADKYPKLGAMFDALDNWVKYGNGLPDDKVLDALSLSGLKLNKGGVVPGADEAPLLAHIERLHQLIAAVAPAFLAGARDGIDRRFRQQKQQRNLLTPDDLLLTLSEALAANPASLGQAIASRFPVALIDEFQDTDPLQFAIFSGIYQQQPAPGSPLSLLMIGDPKQAIYAFRGADIHTYIQARNETQAHYYLETNYRSSAKLVTSVNSLFQQSGDPFLSRAIPFDAVATPASAANKCLTETGGDGSALRLRLLAEDPDKGLNKLTARAKLADDAAAQIARLLTQAQQGQCHIAGQPLKAKDIAVLVRDRNEAAVMKEALGRRSIGAVFLSRDSVFDTLEARELALVLAALANPRDERALRSALATRLLGFDALQIHGFNQDEERRQTLLGQFFELHNLWLRRGIMPALLNLANDTGLIGRLLASDDGERRLTDFRHLAELLQQKATELDGSSALVNWYQQQLLENSGTDEQQLRLESEQNLVQLVTIHKSKGLEYPVCLLPFVSLARDNRRKPAPMLYHEEQRLLWDIEGSDEGWQAYKREVLAEDIRLLYVALTRPVYLCYLYVANHSKVTKVAGLSSQLHETGIGYLLGIDSKDCDFGRIQAQTQKLASEAISIESIPDEIAQTPLADNRPERGELAPKPLNRPLSRPWRVGSYSGLVKNLPHERTSPGADDESFDPAQDRLQPQSPSEAEPGSQEQSRFSFERGANAGSFMHLVLELIDFTVADPELERHLPQAMAQYGIDPQWQPLLEDWYLDLLHAPLRLHNPESQQAQTADEPLCLSRLCERQKLVEMEFYLPLARLDAGGLNALLTRFGYGGEANGYRHELSFDELEGMLKGFIDLTFEHQGRFYICDYKSNHLGDDFSHYRQSAMTQAIRSHRYDLQYLLYTLALHRYLGARLTDYDYDRHIGGCYYLFLRGMSVAHPDAGIFYDKPPKALIQALDALFNGEPPTPVAQEAAPHANPGAQMEFNL
ncbi:exodeoxyribonuclease V subunit beta [Shewanella sp. AS16]|uniref:exodeoxyribonuclease V subunit beta n=1 Tax=Shewanella sp. AS16 TaxID=2907625 RepID=UPI001F307A8C|nr:exodeoxyribonuclease V subunit beta [Shewanella sp. AS16]MCE9687434.1 exodeoxyribonuclease V subunit beta [Shewanella sp. AS16]